MYLLQKEKYLCRKSFHNNAVKIVKHTEFLPLFVAFYSQLLGVLWSGFHLGAGPGVSRQASAAGVFRREEHDVHAGGGFFLTPGPAWSFLCLLTCLCTSFFLHGSSALCHIPIYYMWWLLMRAKKQFLLPQNPALSSSSCAFL